MSTNTNDSRFTAHMIVDEGLPVLSLKSEVRGTLRWVYTESHPKASGFTVAEAMAILSPVDCAYTLVFTRGKGVYLEQTTISVSAEHRDIRKPNCGISMSKDEALLYFAHYNTVELTDLRAIIPEPEGPHCRIQDNFLRIHRGDEQWIWMKTERIYLGGDLSTTDLAAICNPHKCNVRIKAVGPNAHKVTYFTAGKAMTPGDLLEYEYLELISAEPSEEN
jgi:hypothetical protein